jgi:micrococcal nuclease
MYTYKAKITEVYDGDTVTALVDLGFRISFEIKIRLLGINTPELRGAERPQGLIARDRLRELILNKEVVLKTEKDRQEKFGRWLGKIFLPNSTTSVNQQLIEEGLTTVYK